VSSVFLVGFMGTGKSALGRDLANRLGWRFVDLDEEIVSQAGRSIPEIFEAEGEDAFREFEIQALSAQAQQEQQVVACGGGVLLRSENRSLLLKQEKVLCLVASADEIWRRISGDPNRPLLKDREAMERRLKERQPFYELFPSLDTEGRSVADLSEELLHRLDLRP